MNDCEPTCRQDTIPGVLESGTRPPASSPAGSLVATTHEQAPRPRTHGPLSSLRRGLIVAAALVGSLVALFVGLGAAPSGAAQKVAATSPASHLGAGGLGSNARSGPAAGGTSGTIGNVAKSSFTLTTSAGQEVTIEEQSSTKYEKGTTASSRKAITKDETVLVLGTVSSTTIKATDVDIRTTVGGSKPATAATVVPFQRGAQVTSKQVGAIPAGYSQGSGTIVSGTVANRATEAALTAYPGGVVDRVVKLSNGDYEVHNIGVNWPHHIFVNRDFKVVGAD